MKLAFSKLTLVVALASGAIYAQATTTEEVPAFQPSLVKAAEAVTSDKQLIIQTFKEFMESEEYLDVLDASIQKIIVRQQMKQREMQLEQEKQDKLALESFRAPTKDEVGLGDPEAEYTLVTYTDLECPYCTLFDSTAVEFIEKNQNLNHVYREFPIASLHPDAVKKAEMGLCLEDQSDAQTKHKYYQEVFAYSAEHQKVISIEGARGIIIKDIKADEKAFDECMDSGAMKDKLNSSIEEAGMLGIQGTPTSVMYSNRSGKPLMLRGSLPIDQLEKAKIRLMFSDGLPD